MLYIGLMSGTSLDGVDAVLVDLSQSSKPALLGHHFKAYSQPLRDALLALQHPEHNELETSALLSQELAILYADAVNALISTNHILAHKITAIGCHGQTIRHRPEMGFTMQICNSALLAELTNITVVSDFRSRDVAAGGQGAPLVPAFHAAVFGKRDANIVVLNIGGIANLTYLPVAGDVIGFDTGPGNMLMNAWTEHHLQQPFDAGGEWASRGQVIPDLLSNLLAHPYFSLPAPKSTGRDLFNLSWLQPYLQPAYLAEDVERTLLELTAASIANAILKDCAPCEAIYVCGGGAFNTLLVQCLQARLSPINVFKTDSLGLDVSLVEATAFAWLAKQCLKRQPGNLPKVTGAKDYRTLGAIYYN